MTRLYLLTFAVYLHLTVNNAFEIKPRIINGLPAKTGDFPFFAYLQCFKENNIMKHCGSTIISDEWIVTAAHCLVDVKALIAHFGKTRLDKFQLGYDAVMVPNTSFHIHHDYSKESASADIGM